MRIFSLFLFAIILVSSCHPIRFDEPQPRGKKVLLIYPEELRGTWMSGDPDTLWITEDAFYLGKENEMFSLRDTLEERSHLRQKGDYYFMNFKEEDGTWVVMVVQLRDENTISLYMSDLDMPNMEKALSKYGKASVVLDDAGQFDYYLISRAKRKAVLKMIKDGYFDEITFSRSRDIPRE
jgi:hypothetical protein